MQEKAVILQDGRGSMIQIICWERNLKMLLGYCRELCCDHNHQKVALKELWDQCDCISSSKWVGVNLQQESKVQFIWKAVESICK